MATPTPTKKKTKALGAAVTLPEAEDPEQAAPDQRDIRRAAELAAISALILALYLGRRGRFGQSLWDPAELKYRKPSGGYFTTEELRRAWTQVINESRNRARTITGQILNREISIAEWQYAMVDEIKAAHTLMGALAQGGQDELSPGATSRIGQIIQPQFDYLNKRAAKITTGEQPLSGTLINSAILYPPAAKDTYFEVQRQAFRDRRAQVAQRFRNADESCEDCVDWEGFWLIDEVPPIGSSRCITSCQCDIVFFDELPPGEVMNDFEAIRAQTKGIVREELARRQAIK